MLKIEQTETGLSKKLTPKYKAPYEIIEIWPNNTYKLLDKNGGKW
jgi:hypothetical protein